MRSTRACTRDVDSSGFEFDVPQEEGVYVPIQVGYEPRFGRGSVAGPLRRRLRLRFLEIHGFLQRCLPGASTSTHNGNTQFWLLTDQMLVRNGKGDEDGIIALAGFINNDPENSTYAQQYFAGLLDRDFWQARPQDTIGLLFSYFAMSGQLGKVQAEEQEFGLPFSNGATGIQTHEMILEANYNIHVYRGLDFRPEFQYVFRPNAQSNIRNAAVFGFKAHVEF